MAKKFRIKKHIIVGDFLDLGLARGMLYNITTIGKKEEESPEYSFSLAADVINRLLDWFDEIYLLTGNHDVYFLKILQGKIKMERFWQMIGCDVKEFNKKFHISTYPFCSLNDTWHITHPSTYSRIPMTVARAMSTKYRKSVLSAHGHQFGLSTDISGRDICGDTGGMFNYSTMDYKWLSDTTHPQWVSGFWIIRNNYPYLFSDLTTDWKFWLKGVSVK